MRIIVSVVFLEDGLEDKMCGLVLASEGPWARFVTGGAEIV